MGEHRIAIMVGPHGRGSNMRALIEASQTGHLDASIVRVIAPKADTPALAISESLGIPTLTVEYGENYPGRLLEALSGATTVALAGYLKIVPPTVIGAFPHRIFNIHPSLLPKFGGVGMYGIRVHAAVIAAGETESGCTVHYVSDRYDEGEIILQARCPVLPTDTPEELAARVLALEHRTYAAALQKALHAQSRS